MNHYAWYRQYWSPLPDFDGPAFHWRPEYAIIAVLAAVLAWLIARVLQLADQRAEAGDSIPAVRVCVLISVPALAWLYHFHRFTNR